MYTDLYINQKKRRLPYIVMVIVFFAVSGFAFFITQDSSPTRASRKTLLNHEIVSVSPGQIGVFWETDQPDEGWLIYGDSPGALPNIVIDERDIRTSRQKRKYHFAVIKNIEPDKTYYYNIISDNEVIKKENGEDFSAKSLPANFSSTNLAPIYGKMVFENGSPASDSLSMVIIGNAYPIMSVSSSTGEWLSTLSYLASKDAMSPVVITDKTPITIQLFNDEVRSMIRSTAENSRPVPQVVILGNNYSFMTEGGVLGESSVDTTYLSKPSVKSKAKERDFELRFPLDGAIIPGVAPIIKGYGLSGQIVRVSILGATTTSATTTVDQNGDWYISISKPFLPGKHTIKVESINQLNNKETISRQFTIIKSGERVLGEETSTPSASLTPQTTATPARPQPTVITVSPRPTTLPTVIVQTPIPTNTQGPTPTLIPTTSSNNITPTPPVSGVSLVPYLVSGVGIIMIGIGTALIF